MTSGALRAAVALDFKVQWRSGFYYAAVFSTALWMVVLFVLPDSAMGGAMPYVIFGDMAIIGFFFIAGVVFFEKGERTVFALLVTPLRFGEYLAAKLITLTALAVAASLMVALVDFGLGFSVVALLVSVVLISLLMLLSGLISAVPFPSISEWLLPSTGVVAVLSLPLIHYSGLWQNPVFYAIPTHGPLYLLGSAFGQVSLSAWQVVYALAYPVAWVALLSMVAGRVFDRYIVAREGSA
jgi:fluoroquinolone transport system permease protein